MTGFPGIDTGGGGFSGKGGSIGSEQRRQNFKTGDSGDVNFGGGFFADSGKPKFDVNSFLLNEPRSFSPRGRARQNNYLIVAGMFFAAAAAVAIFLLVKKK